VNIKRKLGKFKITLALINNNPQFVMDVMARVIIIEAKYDILADLVKYTAMSEYFEECPVGTNIPIYEFSYDDHNGHTVNGMRVSKIAGLCAMCE
jgi:hypothetical protein